MADRGFLDPYVAPPPLSSPPLRGPPIPHPGRGGGEGGGFGGLSHGVVRKGRRLDSQKVVVTSVHLASNVHFWGTTTPKVSIFFFLWFLSSFFFIYIILFIFIFS